MAPFKEFIERHRQADDVLMMSIQGISLLPHVPNAVRIVAEYEGEPGSPAATDYARRLEMAKRQAELAQRELDTGFPVLYSQWAVALWNGLECLIRDFVVSWLANQASATQVEAVRKIRIRLADYERMTPEERHYYVIDMLEQEHRMPGGQGVNRFEDLLAVFGLSGPVEDEAQKYLFELCHVRHVLVHRRGLADGRLIRACPWLGLKPGDPVIITPAMAHRYSEAIDVYVATVMRRVLSYFDSSGGPTANTAGSGSS
jgi:hypothetical protein